MATNSVATATKGSTHSEETWIISACKDYLLDQTNASRWGMNPVSFGFPSGKLDDSTTSELAESGFLIVGDLLTERNDGLFYVHRNGASLEKGVADIELLQSAEQDSLVSIHWRARVGDLRVWMMAMLSPGLSSKRFGLPLGGNGTSTVYRA